MFILRSCEAQIHNVKFHTIVLMEDAEHRCYPQQGKNKLFGSWD
jgi:hypothetical protein